MSAIACAKCGEWIRAGETNKHMVWRDRGLRQVLVAEHVSCPRDYGDDAAPGAGAPDSAPSAPEKPTAA